MKNIKALTRWLGKQLFYMLELQLYNNSVIKVKYVKHLLYQCQYSLRTGQPLQKY
jgi:hypothetical protein